MATMKYLNDPLSKETPYDALGVKPDTPIGQIQKKFKELQKKYWVEKNHDKLEELNESRELLGTTRERLKVDFFYYCIPEANLPRKDSINEG